MNTLPSSGPDSRRTRLRDTVAKIERELSRLPRWLDDHDGTTSPDGLLASFADLVAQLALGPEPEVRECPVCGHIGMRAATRCGYCWTRLTPSQPDAQ